MQLGNLKPEKVVIKVEQIINENIELINFKASQKNILVEKSEVDDSYVEVDPNMISTVVRNILNNAVKFTFNKGKIQISSKRIGTFVEIAVKDNGVGIRKEVVPKLFNIDKSVKTIGTNGEQGTGLGLVLSKEFVERNGGELLVESEFTKGSTFKIILPHCHPS